MTPKPPLVSIVTPVYNMATYLPECIQSVLAQSYENWEYIIVDNCSTDASLEIAREYANKDSRIRVCQNAAFLNVIQNHNAALRQISAASKYCKVVFADDWIYSDCLQKMVTVAEKNPSVGLVGAYVLEGSRVTCTGLPYHATAISGREICRLHLLEDLYVFGSANSVLFRSDLIRKSDPLLNELNIHADTEAFFDLLTQCDFGFVHQVLTFTRVREDSLTSASDELNTDMPGMLHILLSYGQRYLTEEELRARLNRHLNEYYELLVKAALRRCDRRVWQYHVQKLASVGGFSKIRFVRAAVRLFIQAALSPGQTLQKLLSRRHARKNRKSEPTLIAEVSR